MPVYGLNVTSMLKHKTLVMTLDAVNTIEQKLLFAVRRLDLEDKMEKSSTHGNRVC
jgi:large subunit ribosomal protein L4